MSSRPVSLLVALIAFVLPLINCASSPTLSSIQVTPNPAAISTTGGTAQFTATATYTHGSHPSSSQVVTSGVTWASSSTDVATISPSGLATAVGSGATSITATMSASSGPVVGSASLVVTTSVVGGTRQLTEITITPASQTLNAIGEIAQFIAIGTYTSAPTTQDITSQVSWVSSAPSVATISSSGIATAAGCATSSCVATMTATATAQNGATIVGTGTLNVSPGSQPAMRTLTTLTLTPAGQTLNSAGQTAQFIALGTFSSSPTTQDLTTQVKWQSSDATVATISASGLATAVGCATSSCVTTITATGTAANGGSVLGAAALTVSPSSTSGPRALISLTLTPASQALNLVGQSAQFVAIGTFSSAPATADLTTEVKWQSSDSGVATINQSGLATAVGCVTTSCVSTITATAATAGGGSVLGAGALTVTPAAAAATRTLTALTLTPNTQVLNLLGETAQFIPIGTFSSSPTTQDMAGQVTWQSSDTYVATVDANGLATAVGCSASSCLATITSMASVSGGGNVLGAANVTVFPGAPASPHTLTNITIIPGPGSQTIDVGDTEKFLAIGTFNSSPVTEDLTDQVTWGSSDVDVATINSTGLATGLSASAVGQTPTITASMLSSGPGSADIVGTSTLTVVSGSGSSNLPSLAVYAVGSGTGAVTSSPLGILCAAGNVCTAFFTLGQNVMLTAAQSTGSTFGGWSANCTPVTATTCTVSMTNNQTVGVIFNKN